MNILYLAKDQDPNVIADLDNLKSQGQVTVVACLPGFLEGYEYLGYNTMTTNQLFSLPDMKQFDVIVGNPPYSDRSSDSDNSANLDSRFVEKCMEIGKSFRLIIRAKHFTSKSSKFRKKLFSSGHLIEIRRCDDSMFPSVQNTETCIITWSVNHNGKTRIVYKDGSVVNRTLNIDTVIKLDNPNYVDSVSDNLSSRWIRGKLNRNKIQDGDVPMVEICGTGDVPVVSYIQDGLENTCRNQYGVVVNVAAEWGSLGRVMIKPFEASISSSIMCLVTDTEEEAIQLKEYLETDEVRELVRLNMPSFHPTKDLFKKIPDPFIK